MMAPHADGDMSPNLPSTQQEYAEKEVQTSWGRAPSFPRAAVLAADDVSERRTRAFALRKCICCCGEHHPPWGHIVHIQSTSFGA